MRSLWHTIAFLVVTSSVAIAQSYISYFTGNVRDTLTSPLGGTCLMGGSSENDEAMKWFLRRASGGDVLVLRASGSDGYNDYMYSRLGIPVNSVESIVFNNSSASEVGYIHRKIVNAEAIWLAGGNQWKYVSYWRNTKIDSLINTAIKERNVVIGGTSAGMAVLGGYYFSARHGTVTADTALANPHDKRVAVDSAKFITVDFLSDVVTDTHYSQRNRQGRHVAFISRILTDYGVKARGLACDERIAVCIGKDGMAHVYGDYPDNENKAYFIRINDELSDVDPENCSPGEPLNWHLGGKPLVVYAVHGTMDGKNTFSLRDWNTGEGGTWEFWYVDNGVLEMNK